MDFTLNDTQRAIQGVVRDFARREIIPKAAGYDQREEFPWEIIQGAASLGLLGILVPDGYGGAGMDYVSYVAILEELGRADGSVALTVEAHNSLAVNHILLFGTEEQRRRYLPALARGEMLSAWALTEPGSGSDAAAMRTTAVRQDDAYVLSGTKNFITSGSIAGVYVFLALSDPTRGSHGISAFILEKGAPGFSVGRREKKLGVRASDTAQLILDHVRLPAENLLGKMHHGFIDAPRSWTAGGSASPPWPSGWPGRPWRRASRTASNGCSSASRSARFKPSNLSSQTWRPPSTPRVS